MVENLSHRHSFGENAIALAKLSIPVAALLAIGVPAAAGWISQTIATYQAENMLGQLGLFEKIPVTDGFNFSKDGTEISFGLDLPQKNGTSHHMTVIFSKDKVSETIVGNSKDNPAIKIVANNVISQKSLSFSPFSLPHSDVIDIKNSNEVRLEGNVEVFLPTKKMLDNPSP